MSRPNQVRIMLGLSFLLTPVAGAVVGAALMRSSQTAAVQTQVVTPIPAPSTTNPSTQPSHRNDRSWFTERLSLSPQQQEEWTKIWSASPHEKFKQIGQQEHASYQ